MGGVLKYFHQVIQVQHGCGPTLLDLLRMEKEDDETFHQYAQRWLEASSQIYPPLIDKEMIVSFISTLSVYDNEMRLVVDPDMRFDAE